MTWASEPEYLIRRRCSSCREGRKFGELPFAGSGPWRKLHPTSLQGRWKTPDTVSEIRYGPTESKPPMGRWVWEILLENRFLNFPVRASSIRSLFQINESIDGQIRFILPNGSSFEGGAEIG